MNVLIILFHILLITLSSSARAQESSNAEPNFFDKKPNQQLEDKLDLSDDSALTVTDLANHYYQRCVKEPVSPGSEQSQTFFCGCLSSRMAEHMDTESVRNLFQNEIPDTHARDMMAALIYIPCANEGLEMLMTQTCVSGTILRKNLKNPFSVCECIGDRMADYLRENGDRLMKEEIIRQSSRIGNIQDLMDSLMKDKRFTGQSEYMGKICLRAREFGWSVFEHTPTKR